MLNKIIVILLIIYGCAIDQPISNSEPLNEPIQISSFGTDSSLDIITWNIEHFPKNGNTTIDAIIDIIRDLNVDIFAFQEIESASSFNELVSSLECQEVLYNVFGDCNQSLGWLNTENGCEEIFGCENYDIAINFYLDYNDCNNACNVDWEGFRANSASYSMNLAYIYNSSLYPYLYPHGARSRAIIYIKALRVLQIKKKFRKFIDFFTLFILKFTYLEFTAETNFRRWYFWG